MDHDPASDQQSTGRTILTLAVKVVVSVLLLWLLFRQTDLARLWSQVRSASIVWLAIALGLYLVMILASVWRWGLLLSAQHVSVPATKLVASYLVATFFNNFLPSNIGGDVVRIRDTVGPARSRTLATIVVLIDRALGLIGLLAVAAVGSTVALAVGAGGAMPVRPLLIWAGLGVMLGSFVTAVVAPNLVTRLLHPLRILHRQWIDARIERSTAALDKFRANPGALFNGFVGAVIVQAVLVAFYAAIASSLHIPISSAHLAVLVPVSFLVQMLPVSVNGLGVREATFSYYFLRLRLPIESALVLSLLGAGLTLLFSISGAIVYSARR